MRSGSWRRDSRRIRPRDGRWPHDPSTAECGHGPAVHARRGEGPRPDRGAPERGGTPPSMPGRPSMGAHGANGRGVSNWEVAQPPRPPGHQPPGLSPLQRARGPAPPREPRPPLCRVRWGLGARGTMSRGILRLVPLVLSAARSRTSTGDAPRSAQALLSGMLPELGAPPAVRGAAPRRPPRMPRLPRQAAGDAR